MTKNETLIDLVARPLAAQDAGPQDLTRYTESTGSGGLRAGVTSMAPPPPRPPANSILEPGPLDVICGKDSTSYTHSGNHHFRALITMHADRYSKSARRADRTHLTISIVNKIHEGGGRFIKKHPTAEYFYAVDTIKAREKVSHALRDVRRFAGKRKPRIVTAKKNEPAKKKNLDISILSKAQEKHPFVLGDDKLTGTGGATEPTRRVVSWDDPPCTYAPANPTLARHASHASSILSRSKSPASLSSTVAAFAKPSLLKAVLEENLMLKRKLQEQQSTKDFIKQVVSEERSFQQHLAAKNFIKQVVSEELMGEMKSHYHLPAPVPNRMAAAPFTSTVSPADYYPAVRTPASPTLSIPPTAPLTTMCPPTAPKIPSTTTQPTLNQPTTQNPRTVDHARACVDLSTSTKTDVTSEPPRCNVDQANGAQVKSLSPFLLALAENELANMQPKS